MIHKKILLTYESNEASLTTYVLENTEEINPIRVRPMVIICPGGGYQNVSEREGQPIAIRLNAMGFHSAVLNYSVKPIGGIVALNQLAQAVSYIRIHAKEWNVDINRIIVCGFSAGGHLAASLGTLWDKDYYFEKSDTTREFRKPNGMILSYPVISSGKYGHQGSFKNLLQEEYEFRKEEFSLECRVDENTVPAFIWHTVADQLVYVENSMLFSWELQKHNIPFELHIYPNGRHGLALATEETGDFAIQNACSNWIDMAGNWIRQL